MIVIKCLRRYFLRKALRNHRSEINYQGWKKVKKIQLIYDLVSDNSSHVQHLIDELRNQQKDVFVLAFMPTKKPKDGALNNTYYSNDVSYLGKPKKLIFNQFNANTDVLIDWTDLHQSPNDFLAAKSNAGFKIGVDRKLPCFDFLVNGKAGEKEKVTIEIMNYLKLINNDD